MSQCVFEHLGPLNNSNAVVAAERSFQDFLNVEIENLRVRSAFDQAIEGYCHAFYDSKQVDDPAVRKKNISQLSGETSFSLLLTVFLSSEEFRREYLSATGKQPPLLGNGPDGPRASLFADLTGQLRTNTIREEMFGDPDSAHRQAICKVAGAADEVGLIKSELKGSRRFYFPAEGLQMLFRERLPAALRAVSKASVFGGIESLSNESTAQGPIDDYASMLVENLYFNAAFERALVDCCRSYYDSKDVTDLMARHKTCMALRGKQGYSLLLMLYLSSPCFAKYCGAVGKEPPRLLPEQNGPRSGTFFRLTGELSSPSDSHVRAIRDAAGAGEEVDLIKIVRRSSNHHDYLAANPLCDLFELGVPRKHNQLLRI